MTGKSHHRLRSLPSGEGQGGVSHARAVSDRASVKSPMHFARHPTPPCPSPEGRERSTGGSAPVLAALAIAAGMLVSGLPAAAQDFYAGKQINFVVGAAAGGGYDLLGRLVARHLGKHIPGNPTFAVQNMPAGASLVAANLIYNTAPRDGLTIGLMQRGILLANITGVAQAQFDIGKYNWLASLNSEVGITIAMASSGVTTTRDLFEKELVVGATGAGSASVQGKWTAEFETQVGVQTYTYEFTVEGEKLTGTAEGSMFGGKVEITDGKVAGSKVTFTEKQDFGGMDIAIAYTGELKGDEIAFSRVVGEFATEELVAKRAKTEAPAAGAAPKKN